MDRASGKLTVFFEEPFWVGVFERVSDGQMSVCKITFIGRKAVNKRHQPVSVKKEPEMVSIYFKPFFELLCRRSFIRREAFLLDSRNYIKIFNRRGPYIHVPILYDTA